MKGLPRFLQGFALLAATTPAMAYTGNDLIRWMPEFEASSASFQSGLYVGYIAGVAEIMNGILFCAPSGATQQQNAAIIAKYLKANPEQWSSNASTIVAAALKNAYPECPAAKSGRSS